MNNTENKSTVYVFTDSNNCILRICDDKLVADALEALYYWLGLDINIRTFPLYTGSAMRMLVDTMTETAKALSSEGTGE